jgi:4-hydroxy-tetrahydrodipicolinate synthase
LLSDGFFFSKMPMRKGSTVALLTPFTTEGKIDIPCLEKLVQLHVDEGTDNLCILGTTAEASTMSMEERELSLSTIVKVAKGKLPIIVGTGTINPNAVKAMTQQAIDLGADANLLVTPYYVKPPQRALIRHFSEIADMGLPVLLYNVPGRTACDIEDKTLVTLAEHEFIVGVKDATGDMGRLASLKKGLGSEDANFLKLSGDDGSTLDFCLQGGDGCVSVTANLAPRRMHDAVEAAIRGDAELANKLNEPLVMLHNNLFVESNPIPAKWAASRMGLMENAFCRLPLDEMDPQYNGLIEKALKAAGLI